MYPKDIRKGLATRLKSIIGQLEGLLRMLDAGEDPEKLLLQFRAANSALDKAGNFLLDEVYSKALAIKIVETTEACPGCCGKEDQINAVMNRFPDLDLDELARELKEVQQLENHVHYFLNNKKSE